MKYEGAIPKKFTCQGDELGIELWPSRGEPMGFGLEHIVPDSLYHKKEWEHYAPAPAGSMRRL